MALLDGDGEVGLDGDAEGRGEWPVLWLADGAGLADLAPCPDFGMTATCGLAAIAGSSAADALLALLWPAAPAAELAAAAVVRGTELCPLPISLTVANPPAASTATAAMPIIVVRESGSGRFPGPRGPGGPPGPPGPPPGPTGPPPGPCGASAFGLLPDVIWRTPAPNMAVSSELRSYTASRKQMPGIC